MSSIASMFSEVMTKKPTLPVYFIFKGIFTVLKHVIQVKLIQLTSEGYIYFKKIANLIIPHFSLSVELNAIFSIHLKRSRITSY